MSITIRKIIITTFILITTGFSLNYVKVRVDKVNAKMLSPLPTNDLIIEITKEVKNMELTSKVFKEGENLPFKYTCDGDNVNPPLEIQNIPANTKSLVLIVDDPDAPLGTFTHWVVWNIDPKINEISENSIPTGSVVGENDTGETTYSGPCPPSGTHRYIFHLYALDSILDFSTGIKRNEVEKAMENHILEVQELIGRYQRE